MSNINNNKKNNINWYTNNKNKLPKQNTDNNWDNKPGWEYLHYNKDNNIVKNYIPSVNYKPLSSINSTTLISKYDKLNNILQKHSEEYKDKFPHDLEYLSEEFEWFSDSDTEY